MPDLLLELFSEEIPARMQRQAAENLRKLVTDALVEAGLLYEGAKAFATPRRLALTVNGLPARSQDVREEKKGPRVGAPEQAVAGFLKSAGLASIADAKIQQDKKGDFYVATVEKPGRPSTEIVAAALPGIIRNFPWPKSMRWGAESARPGALTWVRPLHAILCTFGPENEEPDIVRFEIGGVNSSNLTYGHRFMDPVPISVRRFDDYVPKLEAANVILDADRRKDIILHDARDRAFALGFELVEDEGLLEEVAGLVEWPVVLVGEFDAAFLDIPPEVIRTTIRANQKCFVLRKPADSSPPLERPGTPSNPPLEGGSKAVSTATPLSGRGKQQTDALANRFILVANIEASDGGKAIAEGNGRVIRARLSDARHFWETDLKPLPAYRDTKLPPLDQRLKKLRDQNIAFHEKLGTQGERVDRIVRLAREIAPLVGADPEKAARAAELAKADLVTEMVGEFPELQGLMGKYYAAKQGEDASVAVAIEEHYKPVGPSDRVPSDPVAIAVALADKLDTLVGFWAIDEKPTGSKDPYALRRAALGIIRIVLDNERRVSIGRTIRAALTNFVALTFRPVAGYQSLANTFDPQFGESPEESWSDVPFGKLLNADGFLDKYGGQLGGHQMGNPDLGFDDEMEGSERHAAYERLKERLFVLDGLNTGFMFENLDEIQESGLEHAVRSVERTPWLLAAFESLGTDLLAFFADRLKVQLREQGARHDLVDAVFALGNQDDLLLIVRRVEALGKFLDTEDGKNLLAGYKRATNILRDEEKKSGERYAGAIDPRLLVEPEEKSLDAAIAAAVKDAAAAIAREDFAAAMAALAKLRKPVDAFFDKVRVNAEDAPTRANRLRLLNHIREATQTVADFSRVEG